MIAQNVWRHLLVSMSVLCSVQLGAIPNFFNSAIAESIEETSDVTREIAPTVTFIPPNDDRDPGETASGGTRGSCSNMTTTAPEQPVALVPQTHRGLTLQTHPTFFLYLPQTSARAVFFQLKDESDEVRYQTIVPITDAPGIASIHLPTSEPALELDIPHQWSAVTLCEYDGEQPHLETDLPFNLNDPWVRGWVRRVEPDSNLQGQLHGEASLELAALYAANGIWFDTLAVLATLRRDRPDDSRLAREWETLLQSVGLDPIAGQPLIE